MMNLMSSTGGKLHLFECLFVAHFLLSHNPLILSTNCNSCLFHLLFLLIISFFNKTIEWWILISLAWFKLHLPALVFVAYFLLSKIINWKIWCGEQALNCTYLISCVRYLLHFLHKIVEWWILWTCFNLYPFHVFACSITSFFHITL